MKPYHVPIRTCVSCRETDEKRDLLRIVRLKDGSAVYDARGKVSGRGAYLCARPDCISAARKQKKLERSLKIPQLPSELFDELMKIADANSAPEGEAPTS